jgi:hypothetical protein
MLTLNSGWAQICAHACPPLLRWMWRRRNVKWPVGCYRIKLFILKKNQQFFFLLLDRMTALIPPEKIVVHTNHVITRTQPFEMLYSLNCQNLCADFHEDLDFRFSWGITAMIQRFTGRAKDKKAITFRRQNSQMNVGWKFLNLNLIV